MLYVYWAGLSLHSLCSIHYAVVLSILCYLKGTSHFLLLLHFSFVPILILTGQVILPISIPLLAFVSSLVPLLSPGRARKKMSLLIPLLRQISRDGWYCCCWGYLASFYSGWHVCSILLLCFIVISECYQNCWESSLPRVDQTYRDWISLCSFVVILVLFPFHTYLLQSSLQTSSPKLTPSFIFSIYSANSGWPTLSSGVGG